ncbi:MAG: imidazole glycerol phosphate synthase subunit HisF [Myxococcales bacterium]|nr:imidazole glycerol phosphate synthase subunit HisF [Myxococcales bacterium]
MLTHRVIPCLDIEAGRVVKGVRFQGLRDAGDPLELAARYDAEGADELALLDVRAADQGRGILLDLVAQVAAQVFIPFSVGGGLRGIDDVRAVLLAGADKASIGSAAARDPDLVARCANHFGRQCIVVSLDVKRAADGRFELTTHGGRVHTGLDAVAFARMVADLGAGELLLNDMDADGTQAGFGVDLLQAVSRAVPIPVIASGGAGRVDDFVRAVRDGGAAAVLAASVFHSGALRIADVKAAMAAAGLPVRPTGGS